MNQALALVRFAHASAFTNTPKLAGAGAKRALLRHLADLADWNCRVAAMLNDQQPPACSHARCKWVCFQSEDTTAEDMSISSSAVQRVGRTLEADGWITKWRENMGRNAVTFYEIHRSKLESVQRPRRESKRKLPACLRPETLAAGVEQISTPSLFDDIDARTTKVSEPPAFDAVKPSVTPTAKVGESPDFERVAEERSATRREKVSDSPSLNKKNRNEPLGEPKAIAPAPASSSEFDVDRIYRAYPRHVGKPEAEKAIRAAVKELATGKERPAMIAAEALEFLFQRSTAYAASPAGRNGKFTPHPATWFNQGRYHDDEGEWHAEDQRNSATNRGQARQHSALDALRRADEADANSTAARIARDSQEGSHGGRGAALVLPGA